ncbi:MAG: D-glycero-beta-D-manno-heptose 1,7-bisphosphate 7-phosphatase [Magnetococcales bacterium]|nr:D-glycero-beta-D-manno-heptose 1,7-bisphosphate 7-phosphatase [Magnetococcales bacterium]NGZ26539.1 D-glycero-beta-D-manno-heptose 1,7-bisphosphate 7-phosphatase [Magnetococcales bacterium]
MHNAYPTLLLDRDGVINGDRSDYVLNLDQLVVLPGVATAIGRLKRAGVRVVVITNQGCIAKGLLDEAGLQAIHQRIREVIALEGGAIDAIYHCPHHNADGCSCRKPKPGMILQAQKDWGFDPKHTWMVGDTQRDMEAARAAGCNAALVLTGHGDASLAQQLNVPCFQNLAHFVDAFLQTDHPLFAPCWHP